MDIKELKQNLTNYLSENIKNFKRESNLITLDLEDIKNDPNLYDSILENPTESKKVILDYLHSISEDLSFSFTNLSIIPKIAEIRTDWIGKLVMVRGIIKKATKVVPRTIRIDFECASCGTSVSIPQEKKKEEKPKSCSCGKSRKFLLKKRHIINVQEITMEELPEEVDGKQPQQIRVYIEDKLTEEKINNRLQPGKKVGVIGFIKLVPPFMTQKDEESNISEFMLEAFGVESLEDEEDIQINEEDYEKIIEISNSNPLELLSENLIPEVYGHKEVKKAIVLQMVKGCMKPRSDGTASQGDIHILLSGDPGVAKSVLLKAVSSKCPRARMVVGKRTSGVGLGAMVSRDELSGTWGLEIGSLVLANKSVVCIDELDKMSKESRDELLEPMSLGSITISKAGINAKLSAMTGVLASANPSHGSFDLSEPLARQIDISSPILNRFDLIFVMLDKVDERNDRNAVEHIFDSFNKKRKIEITTNLFKKYITHCRKINPIIKEELKEEIIKFYTKVRQMSKNSEVSGLPINLRNIEGIIRLAEANAKIRLSEKVELKDLEVAKGLFLYALKQVGIDNETGLVDMSMITEKVPTSKRGRVLLVYEIIQSLSNRLITKVIPFTDILNETKMRNINENDLYDYLEDLKKSGYVFENKKGYISII